LIIIEMINAIGEFFLSLMIIIQRQDLIISWFDDSDDELSEDTYVMFFESEFISNKIALKFLKHYINNSDVDSDAEWKLMLMNNHESYITFEFIILTNENHIRLFSLISYLTHRMQSLNVVIFQLYKHWHDQIIQDVVVTSFVKYSIEKFLNDLTKIKNNTFKTSIIRHVLKNPKCDQSVKSSACQSAIREVRRLWYSAIDDSAMIRNWLMSKLRKITRLKASTSCN
jgi:hypothetical protein